MLIVNTKLKGEAMIGCGPPRFYVEHNPCPLGNPRGWLMFSEHATRPEAETRMVELIADTWHDSNPRHWRITADEGAE